MDLETCVQLYQVRSWFAVVYAVAVSKLPPAVCRNGIGDVYEVFFFRGWFAVVYAVAVSRLPPAVPRNGDFITIFKRFEAGLL